jgi:microcystin-dependent protein
MSAELTALESLAANNVTAWFRLNAISQAVLFYATPYLTQRSNWIDRHALDDQITDGEWDTIQAYVDGLLYEAKVPMIGYIIPYVTQDPPPNVLPCDGASYLRVDYPNLYAALDPFFITDADNFTVPDLRGRTVIGAGDGTGLSSRAVGDEAGEELHQLTTGELASHTHSIPLTTSLPAQAGVGFAGDVTVPIVTSNTGSAGGDQAHNNMQPFYTLNYGVLVS